MTAAELRTALRELRLSQRELARRLGVVPVTVNRWLGGELPVPGYASYVAELLLRLQTLENRS